MRGAPAARIVEQETELKLSAAPRTLARLAADPLLGKPRSAPFLLAATYFDTSRCTLWRHGLVLRVRRERGRWIQTVKGRGAVEAGLHRRIEVASPVRSASPDLDRIADPELRAQVAKV